ncbi:DNA endonuclease [Bacteroides phage BU241P1]|nr:DNA endonuclease [Bacteroides phage BU241P1]
MLGYREALELFRYDYETGVLYWRWRINNRVPKTLEAGRQRKSSGYLDVQVHGRFYLVHRVVMLMCYGFYGEGLEVDHINHVRNDNRLVNLRFVTRRENTRNQSVSSKNTSGVTGVYFIKRLQKYAAQIKVNREAIYLGIFETLEEAAAARAEANLKFNFHNNHGKGRAKYVRKKANA